MTSRGFTENKYIHMLAGASLDLQDVTQEQELRRLEKHPETNTNLIAKKWIAETPELLYGLFSPYNATEMVEKATPMAQEDYTKLYEFLVNSEIDSDLINEFFDNPDEEYSLSNLLQALFDAKIITRTVWRESRRTKYPVTQIVLDNIEQHSLGLSLDEIAKIVSIAGYVVNMVSKRPMEAARMAIKSLLSKELIRETETKGVYVAA